MGVPLNCTRLKKIYFCYFISTGSLSNVNEEVYLQSFMTNEISSLRSHQAPHIDQSARSTPDSPYHEAFSSPLSACRSDGERTSQFFDDDIVVVSESFVNASTMSASFSFEESELDKLPTDNIFRGPPVSGG